VSFDHVKGVLELFERDIDDVEIKGDGFVPVAKNNKGVRLIVRR